jgi:alpha-ketoglutarate-dependent taurine dioxygenase
MATRFQPLSPRVGATATLNPDELLDPSFADVCLEALEQYGVLVFPRLGLSGEQQVTFTSALGKAIPQGPDPIFKVSLDPRENVAAEYLKGTVHWHIDGATDDVPARATMLTAIRLAPKGGQTEFCNTYAAFEDLPTDERPQYAALRIVHSLEAANRLMNPNPTDDVVARWRMKGAKEHPLAWRHQTGRTSLVLGATVDHVVGVSAEESKALVAHLTAHATRPENVYRHEWQIGDLVIWDNTGTMHRVTPYDANSGRLMHRTSLEGIEAIVG